MAFLDPSQILIFGEKPYFLGSIFDFLPVFLTTHFISVFTELTVFLFFTNI